MTTTAVAAPGTTEAPAQTRQSFKNTFETFVQRQSITFSRLFASPESWLVQNATSQGGADYEVWQGGDHETGRISVKLNSRNGYTYELVPFLLEVVYSGKTARSDGQIINDRYAVARTPEHARQLLTEIFTLDELQDAIDWWLEDLAVA